MEIDPRAPRFGALITTFVFVIGLAIGFRYPVAAAICAGAQAVVFAIGAGFGLRWAPYGVLYRKLIRPRLGPPAELEPEAPPRFAQGVGVLFAVLAAIGYASGLTPLGIAGAGAALIAAFLNGAFGFCLGCEMYLIIRTLAPSTDQHKYSGENGPLRDEPGQVSVKK